MQVKFKIKLTNIFILYKFIFYIKIIIRNKNMMFKKIETTIYLNWNLK